MLSENTERKKKTTKKKKRRFSIIKILILTILLLGFIGAGAVGGLVVATLKSAKPIDPTKIYTILDENSFILDKEGNLIEKVERSDGLRTIVKYDEIPQNLKDAFIAIEDQDFFTHKGISPKRIIKSAIDVVRAGGNPVSGGSTITQQLAKNLYLSHDKTYTRKIKEAYYAFQLEKHLRKEQIFEAYMNTAHFGGGANGVQAAAFTFFSKDVSELDLAECALIAGITQHPSKYSPLKTLRKEDVDPEKHHIVDDSDSIYTVVYDDRYKDRQQLVLRVMKNKNMITEEEYNQAINEDLKPRLKPGKQQSQGISSFFVDLVKQDVIEALKKELGKTDEEALDMLYNQGLRIYSTMDLKMQKSLETVYQDSKNFPNLIAKKDGAGNLINNKSKAILMYKLENLINSKEELIIPKSDYKYDAAGNLVLLKGKRLSFEPLYENGEVKGIQVLVKDAYIQNSAKEYLMLKGGVLRIAAQHKQYDEQKNLVVSKEFLDSNPQFFQKDGSENLLISKDDYTMSDKGVIQPQSSMVIMDYRSGEIKALVGGRDIKGRKLYNRATNPRQPGSSIKPLSVFTPALDNGWTAASVVDDVPNYDHTGKMWPRNYYNSFWGLSTLRDGVQWSMNVLSVKVVERLGVNTSVEYLKKMGITTVDEKGGTNDLNLASMSLGGMTRGISPLEMTAAYGSLANQGVYMKPKSFIKITDREGNLILENGGYKNRVVSPEVAYIITDMMRSVVSGGTGQRAKLDQGNANIPVAGKTGTTTDNYDAWFVGYTPYYVGAVWIGNDVQIELNSGSAMSAQLWKTVMAQVHQGLPAKNFDRPENVISVQVDKISGKRPTELSLRDPRGSQVHTELFVKGTEPKEHDDVHVEVEIDTSTGKLATPYCPPTLVEKRVFVRRPIPYNPSANNGIVPRDYPYEVPTAECTAHSQYNQDPPAGDNPTTPGVIDSLPELDINNLTEDPNYSD
ncbi:MAG: PBP1A family penicillin-binding protein [Geosporobacter ferrireducens]|nr:PBP1A family penicillin-binding protein [Geosporobacter ferrireducens]